MSKIEVPEGTLIKPAVPSICLGLTAYRTIEQKTVQSLFNAMGQLPYKFGLVTHTSANVWRGRNVVVEGFLESPADFLMFVDADMVFTPEDMGKMIEAALENPDAGVIAGFYCVRDETLRPLVGWTDEDGILFDHDVQMEKLKESRGKLVEANMLPTGFMLIRRSVFEKLKAPWFIVHTVQDEETDEIRHYSSDNYFVQKCNRAGIKTYAHFGVELGHVGNFVYHPAQMWPQLEAFSSMTQLRVGKEELGKRFGWNTREYWDALYSLEKQLGVVRGYAALHEAVKGGMQPGWNVLDVGSGPGVLAEKLKTSGCDVTCYDLADSAVRYCEEKGLTAKQWDLVNDDVPTGTHGTFDSVVCTEVLEHLDNPAAAIKKLYSFLKEDGMVVLTVPDNRLTPEEEPEHVQVFTAAKLAKLMTPFKDVFIEPINGYLIGVGKKPQK